MASATLLDANVLHPMVVCDLLIRLALADVFSARWSWGILNEVERSVANRRPDLPREALRHRIRMMDSALPDAMIDVDEDTVDALAEFGSDAHVVAAAKLGEVELIVTQNVKHFPAERVREVSGAEVLTIDRFLSRCLDQAEATVLVVLGEQSQATERPHLTVEDILIRLEPSAPVFVQMVRSKLLEHGA